MPIPNNISNNAAGIYEASLMYEQNGKCGTTRVLESGDSWTWETNNEKCWKIYAMAEATVSALAADNLSAADCTKIVGETIAAGVEIMGSFTSATCSGGILILYMDCPQS
jgi:hypothetical protein